MGNILHSPRIKSALVFAYLALFPLGQLPRFFMELVGLTAVHFTDVVVLVLLGLTFFPVRRGMYRSYLVTLVVLTGFSFLVPGIFSLRSVLYAVRLAAYIHLGFVVYDLARAKSTQRLILQSLVLVSVVSAVVGIGQYMFASDLRTLKTIGWDDHYFRLVGTLLDPAFTGILLVLGTLLTIVRREQLFGKHILLHRFVIGTLGLALLLTYSRASFLALFCALLALAIKHRYARVGIFMLVVGIALLPQSLPSEGVKLTRSASVIQKYENAFVAREVIASSPLFGVGMDLCRAKEDLLGIDRSEHLHDCSGLENSVLFAFAAWGIAGVGALLGILVPLTRIGLKDTYVRSMIVAVFVHMQFTNTLFYPWVMGWIVLSCGIVARELTEKKSL